MKSVHVILSRACQQACVFCSAADWLDGAAVAPAAIRAAIDAGARAGARRVVFTGGEPTLSAQLVKAIAYARAAGLRTAVATHGRLLADADKVGRLAATGLDEVLLSVHAATEAGHRAITGDDPVSWDQTRRALALCAPRFDTTLRTVLLAANQGDLPALLDLAQAHGTAFELRRLRPEGRAAADPDALDVDDVTALTILEATLREAARRSVTMRFSGFDGSGQAGQPAPEQPVPLDPVRWRLLQAGAPAPEMRAGLRTPAPDALPALADAAHLTVEELALSLSARGFPLLDLPPRLGGTASRAPDALLPLVPPDPLPAWRPAGGPVHVVVGPTADPLLAASTLPGLAHALQRLGADVHLHTAWDAPFDPGRLRPARRPAVLDRLTAGLRRTLGAAARPVRLAHPDDPPGPPPDAALAALHHDLDLSGAAVVVVSDLATLAALRAARRLPATARVCALDHGLDGFDGALGPEDVLRSPLPGLAALYTTARVPLRHLHWRPWPVHHPHLPPPAPPAASRDVVLLGEADPDLLSTARQDHSLGVAPLSGSLEDRLARLSRCRFVWAPAPLRKLHPPDVRWATVAVALGRPVLATEVPGLADLVVHGVSGHLVRPADAARARTALRRLAVDDAWLTALGVGARAAGARSDTAVWAEEILDGAPRDRVVPTFGRRGPWRAW